MDNSRQVVQTVGPYKYGEENHFKTKKEVIEKMGQKVKTAMALQQIYQFSQMKTIEGLGEIQFEITTTVPKIVI